jgi:hypothetical protein
VLGIRENILHLPGIRKFLGHPSNRKTLLLPLSETASPSAEKFDMYVQLMHMSLFTGRKQM